MDSFEDGRTPDEGFKSITEPGVAEAVAAALGDVDTPTAQPPRKNVVELLGGVMTTDGKVTEVEVRELTGEAEEILARAALAKPNNLIHFINAMLEWAVIRFGYEDEKSVKAHLKNTFVGDRDAIILGIRRATYGDYIDLEKWICPNCGDASDLSIPVDDIPMHKMEGESLFNVPLLKGGHAEVRLANGGDQLAVFSDTSLSPAERDTVLLSRCVIATVDKNGDKHQFAGFASSMSRNLNLKDRHAILRELNERQPGPRLAELTMVHDTCQVEVNLLLTLADLFRDLVMV